MLPTDITIADWLEVIRAEDREMPKVHSWTPRVEQDWSVNPYFCEALVAVVEVEYLKRVRHAAYAPDS